MSSIDPSGVKTLLEQELPNVPRETRERLLRYTDLIMAWNKKMNLTGAENPTTFLKKHVLDCAQAYFALPKAEGYVDLGTGAGLPGLVWALLAPEQSFILVEVLKKRCAFLRRAMADLKIENALLYNQSFQDFDDAKFPEAHAIVSRGTWPPDELLRLAQGARSVWTTWWVFTGEKLHAQYLKFSPHYKIRVQLLNYVRNSGEMGYLTRLDRE